VAYKYVFAFAQELEHDCHFQNMVIVLLECVVVGGNIYLRLGQRFAGMSIQG
jgi:hypothetical protein